MPEQAYGTEVETSEINEMILRHKGAVVCRLRGRERSAICCLNIALTVTCCINVTKSNVYIKKNFADVRINATSITRSI